MHFLFPLSLQTFVIHDMKSLMEGEQFLNCRQIPIQEHQQQPSVLTAGHGGSSTKVLCEILLFCQDVENQITMSPFFLHHFLFCQFINQYNLIIKQNICSTTVRCSFFLAYKMI